MPQKYLFGQMAYLEFIRVDGTPHYTVAIEIAEGDSARARGLMQRTSFAGAWRHVVSGSKKNVSKPSG